jgi:hypothetical protein
MQKRSPLGRKFTNRSKVLNFSDFEKKIVFSRTFRKRGILFLQNAVKKRDKDTNNTNFCLNLVFQVRLA